MRIGFAFLRDLVRIPAMGTAQRTAAWLIIFGAFVFCGCGSVNGGKTNRRVAPINTSNVHMMEQQLHDRRGY